MQLPMEFLSLPTTRTDSGAGVPLPQTRSRQGADSSKSHRSFEKAFEEELNRHDQKLVKKQESRGDTGKSKSVDNAKPAAVDKEDKQVYDKGEDLAAGANVLAMQGMSLENEATGIEQESVFILEGEESVNPALRELTPQMQAEAGEEIDANIGKQVENNSDAKLANTGTQHADDSETAQFKDILAAKTEPATQENKTDVAGETTARTPEVNSDGKESNGKSDENLKDNGSPRPLENENESKNAREVGQKEDETYKKAADAVSSKTAKDKAEEETGKATANSKSAPTVPVTEAPPPLSEGIKPEQFKATQQMAQAALEHPVKPENLFEEMISRVETSLGATKSTMSIQLNPEYLGKVALEVAVDATGVHVKISAEDSSVRGMINSQLATLIESLESKGLAVSGVEVVYAGANFDGFSEPGDGKQGANHGAAKNGNNAKDGIEQYANITNLMDYYMDAGISSVEYCA